MPEFTPEKSKQIALARLDLIHKWLEFRKKSTNKLQADCGFVKLHNTSIEVNNNADNLEWFISYYSNNDIKRIKDFANEMNINFDKIFVYKLL